MSAGIDQVVQRYGDLVFDLCESVLWNSSNAQLAFRSILKEIRRKFRGSSLRSRPEQNERAWILSIACGKLNDFSRHHARKLTPAEQIEIDSNSNISARLKSFDAYFHRLEIEDQILLLLRDKYGLPYAEIAAALGVPEASLKVRRQQSLRTLDEWIWDREQA